MQTIAEMSVNVESKSRNTDGAALGIEAKCRALRKARPKGTPKKNPSN